MGAFFGANRFKFGMFGLNCAGGMTLSSAPERWRADWDEIAEVAEMADDAGVEFLLPIAKWHGLGGDADMWGRSFETFTQASFCGFYRRVAPRVLAVGPYQGPMGCLRIDFDRGVCGAAARTARVQRVPDVHLFPGHIACDGRSQSEIVVPVRDRAGALIAVFDVDSDQPAAFDAIDQAGIETILHQTFST